MGPWQAAISAARPRPARGISLGEHSLTHYLPQRAPRRRPHIASPSTTPSPLLPQCSRTTGAPRTSRPQSMQGPSQLLIAPSYARPPRLLQYPPPPVTHRRGTQALNLLGNTNSSEHCTLTGNAHTHYGRAAARRALHRTREAPPTLRRRRFCKFSRVSMSRAAGGA